MAAPNNAALLAYADSIAKACFDYNANIANLSTVTTGATTINSGVSGTGGSATLGRILAYSDPTSELALLSPTNTMVSNVAAFLTNIEAMTPFYQQLIPVFNAFDAYINANVTAGGVNAWLSANALQVNAFFAAGFNYFATNAVGLALRTSTNVPVPLSAGLYFPYAIVDPMISFVCGTGITMTSSTPGSASSTQGSGVAPLFIYKTNATAPVGGAALTITYTNAAGLPATTLYTTTSSVPAASSSLASGSQPLGVSGSAVTSVTGAGMTATEAYSIGQKLLRSVGY